ncbi:ferrous iron transport protein A [Flavobacterium ponti]|uniref:Ferrous iron transport protein A n=1 Tax=Flavobacterium ponti TaxID=665133 RepID=A0ABV9NZ26_9FLAO
MEINLTQLKKGERATIIDVNIDVIPLKLLEMGCLPGNSIELIQIAPLGDPLYYTINDSHVAIRLETAQEISILKEQN